MWMTVARMGEGWGAESFMGRMWEGQRVDGKERKGKADAGGALNE